MGEVLTSFAEQLENPTIVALTATLPYDVSPFEWQRYEELCGPIDAEVSVPELVHEGDLCPHQKCQAQVLVQLMGSEENSERK